MTRRMQHYDNPEWRPWLLIAAFGAAVIFVGIVVQILQIFVSIRQRDRLRDTTGDPWNGRSLEWSTASPPPDYNFAVLPTIEGGDAYWRIKEQARDQQTRAETPEYEDIHLPSNTPIGFVFAFFATFLGFAMIWYIWWLAILCLLGIVAAILIFQSRDRPEKRIAAEEVARLDREHRATRRAAFAQAQATP